MMYNLRVNHQKIIIRLQDVTYKATVTRQLGESAIGVLTSKDYDYEMLKTSEIKVRY